MKLKKPGKTQPITQTRVPTNSMKYWIALLCLLGLFFPVAAAEGGPGQERYQPVPEQLVQSLESDDDLEYQLNQSPEEMTLWDRFWTWIGDLYRSLFRKIGSPDLVFYLLLGLGIALVMYGVYRIARAESNGMFSSGKTQVAADMNEEKLLELNLEQELMKAREAKQWRLFIRILYLQVLKKLDERQVISLKSGKTNHDYAYEISDAGILHPFNHLSRIFEYTWYGGFEADEAVANRAEEQAGKLNRAQ